MGAGSSVLLGRKMRRSRLGPRLLKSCRAGDADKATAVRRLCTSIHFAVLAKPGLPKLQGGALEF